MTPTQRIRRGMERGDADPGLLRGAGGVQIGFYEYSREALAFMETLYAASVVVDFAWSARPLEAQRYWEQPSTLQRARLMTLRRLLTLHARKDRFVEGHLAEMSESGHITAILGRAAQLVDQRKRAN